MADLDALKSRVERAERHLESARSARESQSAALAEMWRQFHDRFETQEREIAAYREKLATLEDEHAELTRQVETLLDVVDHSLGRADDEEMPDIAGMAQELLDGDTVPDISEAIPHPADEPPSHGHAQHEVRDIVDHIEGAGISRSTAPDADADAGPRERRDIAELRAELEQLGLRLGARQN